jgi:hypothetical protein
MAAFRDRVPKQAIATVPTPNEQAQRSKGRNSHHDAYDGRSKERDVIRQKDRSPGGRGSQDASDDQDGQHGDSCKPISWKL